LGGKSRFRCSFALAADSSSASQNDRLRALDQFSREHVKMSLLKRAPTGPQFHGIDFRPAQRAT
jgi:hypothetical protein